MTGVYKITFPNGKIYIGISSDIKRRIIGHNTPSQDQTPCDRAINKYGRVQTIEILELFNEPVERTFLEGRETYWIKCYESNNKEIGYNLTAGGDGSGKPNEENPKAVFTNKQVLDIRKKTL